MTKWTHAYMEVLSRAAWFARSWEEYRGNDEFGRVKVYERMRLYCALAIYSGERRANP